MGRATPNIYIDCWQFEYLTTYRPVVVRRPRIIWGRRGRIRNPTTTTTSAVRIGRSPVTPSAVSVHLTRSRCYLFKEIENKRGKYYDLRLLFKPFLTNLIIWPARGASTEQPWGFKGWMIYETIDMEVAIVSTRNHNRETFLSLPRITQHMYKYGKTLPGKRERSKGRPRRRRPPRRSAGRRLTCELNKCRAEMGPLHWIRKDPPSFLCDLFCKK